MKLAETLRLLEQALERAEPERGTYLFELEGIAPEQREAALALLSAHRASAGFLEPDSAAPMPELLGPWRLLAPIGAGGMGRVWLAERADGRYAQRVALKVMSGLLGDAQALQRAAAERQFLAALEHPNITRIFDAGVTPEGQPYVVMELVEGERIDRWCARAGLDAEARVRLFLKVLDAVDAAHRALIVHRDLKPANVLVTPAGEPKLLDFGIAKSLDGGIDGPRTGTGLSPMTPQYASPEQLQARPPTTACDVWSLGVLLYELLTGQLPFDLDGVPLAAMLPRLREAPTTRASQRIDPQRLHIPASAVGGWRRALRGDLDRVLLKALAFEPERRYPSARALGDELQRWLDHQPVLARHGGGWYRFGKFVRRHRLPVAAAGAALLALMIGLGVAAQQAREARAQAARAESAASFLAQMIDWADPTQSGGEITLRQAIDRAAAEVGTRFADQPELEAEVRLALGRGYNSLLAYEAAQVQLDRVLALLPAASAKRASAELSAAVLDWSLGRTDRAEQRYREAIRLFEQHGVGGTPLGTAWSDYAALLNEQERYQEAFSAAVAGLGHIDAVADPRNRAAALGNRAFAEDGLGRFEDAERSYAESSAIFQSLLPATAFDLSINLNNRAVLMRGLNRIADSIPLLEQAIALREQTLGAGHGSLATLYANLARARLFVGDHPGARRDVELAVAIAEQSFAPDYQMRGHVYAAAAQIAAARADVEEARRLALLAFAVYDRADAVTPERRQQVQDVLDALPAAGQE